METNPILRYWFLIPLVLVILGLFLAAVSSGPKEEKKGENQKKSTLALFD